MLLSIIIPVYNEQNTIKTILKKIEKINFIKKEIIIINDGSNDNTSQIIKEECLNLYNECINLDRNYGKGYACRLGLNKANGDIILIQDADLEYDPNDYKKLIEPILRGLSNVVYGSRVLYGGVRKRPFSFDVIIRMFANYFLTYLSNLLNKQKLTDAHTCYKVFSSSVIKKIHLEQNGFAFCPEVTAKISKLDEKIIEVPINYYGRTIKEGKKIRFRDGIEAIKCIIKYSK